jgi:serpin B
MRRKLGILLALILITHVCPAAFAQQNETADLVEGNTSFALDLYAELRQSAGGNLIFSPYSISQALAMTYAGADGETAVQMAETLSFTLDQPALHEAFGALNADLVYRGTLASPGDFQSARALHLANALWGEQTFPFNQTYSEQLEQFYGAPLRQSDFVNAPEMVRAQINAWVAEQTEDRIRDIVPDGVIGSNTPLVLANAIYFYGKWQSTFPDNATSDDRFVLLDGTTATVPFMVQDTYLPYARGDGFQVIEFAYEGSRFAFTVILPDDGQFAAVESKLDGAMLAAATSQSEGAWVHVYLPKFEFERPTDLAPTLQSMGMTDAFDAEQADFTGMVDGPPPGPLYLQDVLHKAFISVDELGTEAAAATVVIPTTGGGGPPAEPLEVRIDRPFIFAIRDTQTGTLLFLGRVMNPLG